MSHVLMKATFDKYTSIHCGVLVYLTCGFVVLFSIHYKYYEN